MVKCGAAKSRYCNVQGSFGYLINTCISKGGEGSGQPVEISIALKRISILVGVSDTIRLGV